MGRQRPLLPEQGDIGVVDGVVAGKEGGVRHIDREPQSVAGKSRSIREGRQGRNSGVNTANTTAITTAGATAGTTTASARRTHNDESLQGRFCGL